MDRILITGAGGFVGKRVISALRVSYPDLVIDAPSLQNDGEHSPTLDVSNAAEVDSWIEATKPNQVLHLAAVAAVTASIADPRNCWAVNLGGTLNIVLAIQKYSPKTKMIYVSSAEVYGRSFDQEEALDEIAPLQPVNPYAASKAAADILVRQVAESGLSTVVLRPFNHIGRGQSELFAVPSFANQIARIEAGLAPPILEVGDLNAQRDFLDVEDVVSAYLMVMKSADVLPTGTVFNIASGHAVTMQTVLDTLLSFSALEIEVRVDPKRLRTTAINKVVGNSLKLRRVLGWAPQISLPTTLAEVLNDCRLAVQNSAAAEER